MTHRGVLGPRVKSRLGLSTRFSISACLYISNLRTNEMQCLNQIDGAQKRLIQERRRALVAMALPAIIMGLITPASYGQKDPGVRGGLANTGGGLQAQGIPIPHPPVISPNPNHPNLTLNNNQLQLFLEGIRRAGQLESTCNSCALPPFGVGDGNPVGPPFAPAGT